MGGVEAGGASGPSPVLRVVVENLFYPVTLDVLHQVDSCLFEATHLKFYLPILGNFTWLLFDGVMSSTDLFQVWHSFESDYFYQEQPVPSSSAVC